MKTKLKKLTDKQRINGALREMSDAMDRNYKSGGHIAINIGIQSSMDCLKKWIKKL